MKYLFSILLLCGFQQLQASNYYFSTRSGDDNRSFLQAQNPLTPWKTLNKLNAVFISLNPGDSVLLKRDEVYDGSLIITKSGNINLPIVFASYGTGAKPVISGLTTLSEWTTADNRIWEAAVASTTMINTVLINGKVKPIGRYPNSTAVNKGYLTFETTNGSSQIIDKELSAYPDWTGGEVVIRKARWVVDRNLITSHSGHTINYTSESANQSAPNFGYFIQNHPKTLDIPGEWYYSINKKKLGIYSASSPSASLIQASTVNTLVSLYNQNNIEFNNLNFLGANISAFEIHNAQHVSITNCDILFSGVNAININNGSDIRIENSVIDYTNNIAINGEGNTNLNIRNNKITNTGTVAGMGKGDSGSYEAIMLTGDNHMVELNEIKYTGYTPITFRGNANIIRNNLIDNFCSVKDDGAGIYSWNNIPNAPLTYGTKIIGNAVLNGKGAGEGTLWTSYLPANGIYMDDNTANVEITGNTVANNGLNGIYLHNVHEIKMYNNTLFNNKSQVVITHDTHAPNSPVRNISMQHNIFFSKEVNQPVAQFYTSENDIKDFGVFDSNYYARPVNNDFIITTGYTVNGTKVNKTISLSDWKNSFGKDLSSKKSPVSVASSAAIRFEYNPTGVKKAIALDQIYLDVTGKPYSSSVSLNPYSSIVLIKRAATGSTPSSGACPGTGSILREQWDNVIGNDVANIPLQTAPSSTIKLTTLETTVIGTNYGDRIRGYLCPPQSGNYTFFLSADDAAELWLSTNNNPNNKTKIASLLSWTNFHEWNKFPSQTSRVINLQAGQLYYIEVLHKQGGGGDHVSVAWKLPNGVTEAPIPGSHLSPYILNGTAAGKNQKAVESSASDLADAKSFTIFPVPVYNDFVLRLSNNYTGNLKVAVIDQAGRTRKEFKLQKGQKQFMQRLSLKDLPNSTYIIQVHMKDKSEAKTIIKL